MAAKSSEVHGTPICSICYENPEDVAPGDYLHRRIGKIIYYRSDEAQVRLDLIPARAWAAGINLFVGNFVPTEKVPEPPFIDGDIMATTVDRGDNIVVGHIHTVQNHNSKKVGEYADEPTQYQVILNGIPVRDWIRIRDADKELKAIYLKVRMA